ncbi:MAG: glycosyltransferase family 4 protein [Pirellulales bacterium]|nr:glycosyltransferase family 4 protein [Pirellulales bacterium]
MHIMEIVSGRSVNGAVFHCLLLSRELVRRGHRVSLVCYGDSWIARQAAADGIPIITSDLHRWPPDELRRLAGLIHRTDVDVVHTHSSRAQFFGILLRWFSGVPSVATAHSRHFQLHWMFNDQVITVSEASRRYQRTRNFVRPSRIETIYNFIDHRRMTDVPDQTRFQVRRSLGIGKATPLIGIVGDIVPRKGLIHLVGAMPEILRAVPETRLIVVGHPRDEKYAELVQTAAVRLGVDSQILWTGYRGDVHEIMAALDVCVLPSLEESFPLSILEAMAARLPVVATMVGGIPECVVDGVTGTLVPPGDSDTLARAIVSILGDPSEHRRLGEAARRRVLQCFSPESQTARVERLFQRVIERRRAA